MFFSTKIFKTSNLSDESAQLATLAVGTVNVIMTIVSLMLVEKAGRKTLLLIGFIGMFFVAIFLTVCLAFAVRHFLNLNYLDQGILIRPKFCNFFCVGSVCNRLVHQHNFSSLIRHYVCRGPGIYSLVPGD